MCPDRRVCVVVLVGIPGSGKSFFRKFFETHLNGDIGSVLGSVQLWSVCYDEFEDMKKCQISKWKQCRSDVMKLVANLIKQLKCQKSLGKNFTIENSGISVINKALECPDSFIILIDDNMYYRSMRYEYYKLARFNNISFSQIYFDVDLKEALKCNSERTADTRVPEVVIENMYKKLEPPQTNHLWETFSVSVLSYADFSNQVVISKILNCLRSALDNPIKEKDVSSKEEETLLVTSSNALHQIDNTLKKLVSDHIKSQVKKGNERDLNLISKVYSERRFKLLKLIKGRVIRLPIDLDEADTEEKVNLVKPILSDLLFSDKLLY